MYKKSRKFILVSNLVFAITTLSNTAVAETMSQDIANVQREIQIRAMYAPSPYLNSHDIKVSVQNENAMLMNKISDYVNKDIAKQITLEVKDIKEEVVRKLADNLILNTHGILGVDNQLTIAESKSVDESTDSSQEIWRRITDSWITIKIKSTFMYSSNVKSANIAVSTSSGVVTLTGKLDSGAERILAVEFAQSIRGVTHVNSIGLLI